MALFLIERRANVTTQDDEGGNMPWSWTAHEGPELVRRLLQLGADVFHDNPLGTAAASGHIGAVRCFVEAGADITASGALHAASYGAHMETVTYLIDTGADVNPQHGVYGSPLHAVLGGDKSNFRIFHHEVFLLLLSWGARADVEALLGAARNLRVLELTKILLELDNGPRYSAIDIEAALVAVRKSITRDKRVSRRDIARNLTRLLEMRLSPSGNEMMKLAAGSDIRALATSIYETESQQNGGGDWNDYYDSEAAWVHHNSCERYSAVLVRGLRQFQRRALVNWRYRIRRKLLHFVAMRRRHTVVVVHRGR